MPVLECACCNELYYSAHASTELSCDACDGHLWRVFNDEVSFARVARLPRRFQPGDHAAILYSDPADAAGFCAAYVREGLDRGEHVLMVAPATLRAAIEAELDPGEVGALDGRETGELYGDFEPRAVVERFTAVARASDRPVRLLSGPDAEVLSGVQPSEWRRYEQLAHMAVMELHATALCVYDCRALPLSFTPVGLEVHPLLSRDGDELLRNSEFAYDSAQAA